MEHPGVGRVGEDHLVAGIRQHEQGVQHAEPSPSVMTTSRYGSYAAPPRRAIEVGDRLLHLVEPGERQVASSRRRDRSRRVSPRPRRGAAECRCRSSRAAARRGPTRRLPRPGRSRTRECRRAACPSGDHLAGQPRSARDVPLARHQPSRRPARKKTKSRPKAARVCAWMEAAGIEPALDSRRLSVSAVRGYSHDPQHLWAVSAGSAATISGCARRAPLSALGAQ